MPDSPGDETSAATDPDPNRFAAFVAPGRLRDGALREGVVHDLLGRLSQEYARGRTIGVPPERYAVDAAHDERVAAAAPRQPDRAGRNQPPPPPAGGVSGDETRRLQYGGVTLRVE